ncbi:ribosome maturation factor RimP [Pseudodesulfovibrio sp. zrk46]|uniref:ribosome maturation factor RimP n=1 Tax=Pseudodesulfovibrio sp. zrk46 TaxID=2725288 RepID=UPI001449D05F|nr:ribosome maturation factor RimP [Pseudodesulfovibrio sp. zrk46]QJB57358.1 ribosome maturation factor RimP [Pseudodesulfovibrio sp. zrk46]
MRQTFEEKLTELIRPEVEGLGCTLWGLTAPTKGNKRIVRIYIEGEGGATIDKCAKVSRQVGLMLEVEDIIPSAFTLEVSSPGLDRRFFSVEQMESYVGKKITAHAYEAVEGRRKFTGELKGIDNDSFTLEIDGEDETLYWTDLRDVRLVYEF